MNATLTEKTLNEVLIEQITELYSVEIQFLRTLPIMAEMANDPGLKTRFMEYHALAQRQLERLHQAAELLGISLAGNHEQPMVILIAKIAHDSTPPGMAKDAHLLCTAHKVESYQKAGSVGICTFAQMLGLDEVTDLLLAPKLGVGVN